MSNSAYTHCSSGDQIPQKCRCDFWWFPRYTSSSWRLNIKYLVIHYSQMQKITSTDYKAHLPFNIQVHSSSLPIIFFWHQIEQDFSPRSLIANICTSIESYSSVPRMSQSIWMNKFEYLMSRPSRLTSDTTLFLLRSLSISVCSSRSFVNIRCDDIVGKRLGAFNVCAMRCCEWMRVRWS